MLGSFLGHSGYGASEGHRKEDIPNKVSDPLFTNLIQRSDNNKKSHAHWMTFWWWSFPLSGGLLPYEDLCTSWSGGIRMLPCILISRNTIVLKRRGS